MNQMFIYEPVKATQAGMVNAEIEAGRQRITIFTGHLKKHGITITRYNLKTSPDEFMMNFEVNMLVRNLGQKCLPITIVNGMVRKKGSYPTKQEVIEWLGIPSDYLASVSEGACCGGGCEGCDDHH